MERIAEFKVSRRELLADMRRQGYTFFDLLMAIVVLLTAALALGIVLTTDLTPPTHSQERPEIKSQDIVRVFKECSLPVDPERTVFMSNFCKSPLLKDYDFSVTTTNTFVNVGNRKLRVIAIRPIALSLPKSVSISVCSAFKEIAKEVERKEGFAYVNCEGIPVLRVGIPADRVPKVERKHDSSGEPEIALFSLFSFISIF